MTGHGILRVTPGGPGSGPMLGGPLLPLTLSVRYMETSAPGTILKNVIGPVFEEREAVAPTVQECWILPWHIVTLKVPQGRILAPL